MKITTILGSPRRTGNTAKLLSIFEENATAAGYEISRIQIADLTIAGCKGCLHCRELPTEPNCAQNDDACVIYDGMMNADVIVMATPLYCWSFPSIMQAAIERCIALVTDYGSPDYHSLIEGKKMALLVTCAGPVEGNADLLPVAFQRLAAYTKARSIGTHVLPFCTEPEEIGENGLIIANALIREICK